MIRAFFFALCVLCTYHTNLERNAQVWRNRIINIKKALKLVYSVGIIKKKIIKNKEMTEEISIFVCEVCDLLRASKTLFFQFNSMLISLTQSLSLSSQSGLWMQEFKKNVLFFCTKRSASFAHRQQHHILIREEKENVL